MAIRIKSRNDEMPDTPRRFLPEYILEDQVGHLLRRANQRHAAIFFEGLNKHHLTPTQFAALAKIGDEEEVSQNRLGRLTAMDPATIFGVVKRLGDRNLVIARPDPDDRRRSLWRLSDTGRHLLEAVIPMGKNITQDTLAPLDEDEQRVFLKLLRKLS